MIDVNDIIRFSDYADISLVRRDYPDIATPESTSIVEFASVSITEDNSFSPIEIEINNVKLSITNNYDEILLLKVINTLRKI